MKKNYTINLKVSKEELDKIKYKASKCGMSVSAYIRFLTLRTNIREVKKLL